ncbi:hypothetical protein IP92_01472 [Pseudoduganella flava]|uniref:Uncharacterized protein n=1 Tax=Pseudoduganella flava TaxID=871742 RepID=A0A562Q0S3_9BURK|nr:hypothetical protein [Pseudoduganella flava]QGZ38227.1 hypothetical protein GO485_03620 [Pseudoduganella flava]TWI50243.1 hypothetical protein IP92_01472 [Pseudoduganella flava]
MTTFPGSPRILKGGIVLLDPASSAVLRVITLQYNADTLSRTLQVQAVAGDGADRSEALRIKGPPAETIKLDAEIDATDQMEFPEQNGTVGQFGIFPQLAVLEALVYPTSAQLKNNNSLQGNGTLEILPMEAPLTLFVWSSVRVLPVRVTDLSVTEEAFDVNLHPIRAKVSLGLRVLSVNDLGFAHKGGNLFMNYLRQKEQLATLAQGGTLAGLGLKGIP